MGMKRLKCAAAPLVLDCNHLWLVIHHWILTQKDFKMSRTKPPNCDVICADVSASIEATCGFLEFRLLARFEGMVGPLL